MELPNYRQRLVALLQAQTFVISLLPFLIGTAFAFFYYRQFNPGDSLLLLIAVVAFHFAVNGHNQYTDYRRFSQDSRVVHSHNNIIARFNIDLRWARLVIGTLAGIATVIGIYLTIKAGWILLLIGGLSFIVGYAYSGGHHPILKTPLGEPASGITMGYNITLLGIYINIYNAPRFDNWFWLKGLLVALPAILVIANVMLANNTCDLEEDVVIGKRTLVYYISRSTALKVLLGCYGCAYLAIIWAVIANYLPLWTLGSLLTIPFVWKHSMVFVRHPQKATTFFNVVVNLQLILVSELFFTIIGII